MHEHDDEHGASHHQGLGADLKLFRQRASRRDVLRLFAVASVAPWLGCGSTDSGDDASSEGSSDDTAGTGSASGSCETIPEETAGPYPGDGSNGKNALALSGIMRSDIRSSVGDASGTAEGVPLTIKLKLVNSADGCNTLAGYAVYLWHCNRDGLYSLYSQGVTDQNYLRGVQETDDEGTVTFTSIFPACYAGRMPHIHFEIFPSVASASSSANKLKTSQLALPTDACDQVFATDGYSQSVENLRQISFETDNVFSDGTALQLATVTGSVAEGYTAALTVAIAD
jgi:protocatechuate 3,4-dioxygenase beta subunit